MTRTWLHNRLSLRRRRVFFLFTTSVRRCSPRPCSNNGRERGVEGVLRHHNGVLLGVACSDDARVGVLCLRLCQHTLSTRISSGALVTARCRCRQSHVKASVVNFGPMVVSFTRLDRARVARLSMGAVTCECCGHVSQTLMWTV